MAREPRRVDVSTLPELKRLANEVAESGEGLVLRDNDIDLVTVAPVEPRARNLRVRERTQADVDAFHSSAGSWADVDVEAFMKYVYKGRDRGAQPLQH